MQLESLSDDFRPALFHITYKKVHANARWYFEYVSNYSAKAAQKMQHSTLLINHHRLFPKPAVLLLLPSSHQKISLSFTINEFLPFIQCKTLLHWEKQSKTTNFCDTDIRKMDICSMICMSVLCRHTEFTGLRSQLRIRKPEQNSNNSHYESGNKTKRDNVMSSDGCHVSLSSCWWLVRWRGVGVTHSTLLKQRFFMTLSWRTFNIRGTHNKVEKGSLNY